MQLRLLFGQKKGPLVFQGPILLERVVCEEGSGLRRLGLSGGLCSSGRGGGLGCGLGAPHFGPLERAVGVEHVQAVHVGELIEFFAAGLKGGQQGFIACQAAGRRFHAVAGDLVDFFVLARHQLQVGVARQAGGFEGDRDALAFPQLGLKVSYAEFARQVDALSDGAVSIEPVWNAAGDTGEE